MNAIISKTEKLIHIINTDIEAYEAANVASHSIQLQSQIAANIAAFSRAIADLEDAVACEMAVPKRLAGKEKISMFKDEYARVKRLYEVQRKILDKKNHIFLLRKSAHESVEGTASSSSSAMISFDEYAAERKNETSLGNSLSRTDEIIALGIASLSDLQAQRNIVKAAHRRLTSVLSVLGISAKTMRLAKKRIKKDKNIFIAGVVLVTLFVAFLYRCFGTK